MDPTAFALKEYADAMMDGLALCATNDPATCGAKTTDSARTEPASVLKGGMENTARYVSNKQFSL